MTSKLQRHTFLLARLESAISYKPGAGDTFFLMQWVMDVCSRAWERVEMDIEWYQKGINRAYNGADKCAERVQKAFRVTVNGEE